MIEILLVPDARGGVPVRNQGDKPSAAPEYTTDFWKLDGVFPGRVMDYRYSFVCYVLIICC
jgi:hypothetical protein